MSLLDRLMTGALGPNTFVEFPNLAAPVCVVGDVHGRDDLLRRLLAQIDRTATRIVFVGDYVDRGPDSAAVLARLQSMCQADPQQIFCLMGNHERMMIDFLDDPGTHGPRWLRSGGTETLASFHIDRVRGRTEADRLGAIAAALRTALPPGQELWLRSLPMIWQEGALAVVHAAADPTISLNAQTELSLLWGHPDFRKTPRTDGIWVVHGHVIVEQPTARQGRIAIDTGAWRTGRLSAVLLADGKADFLLA